MTAHRLACGTIGLGGYALGVAVAGGRPSAIIVAAGIALLAIGWNSISREVAA